MRKKKRRKGKKIAALLILAVIILLAAGVLFLTMRQVNQLNDETAKLVRMDIDEEDVYKRQMVYCVEMILVLTYLMLFWSDVLHVDVAAVGIVMAAVKMLDAVSDIVITSLADRTNTRWGKYRIWILGGIPLAAVLFLLFLNPGFLQTDTAKILWVCVIYMILVPILERCV